MLLEQEGKGNGNSAHIASQNLKKQGLSQDEAYVQLGYKVDDRKYNIVPNILKYFEINKVHIHSNNSKKIESLEGYDFNLKTG